MSSKVSQKSQSHLQTKIPAKVVTSFHRNRSSGKENKRQKSQIAKIKHCRNLLRDIEENQAEFQIPVRRPSKAHFEPNYHKEPKSTKQRSPVSTPGRIISLDYKCSNQHDYLKNLEEENKAFKEQINGLGSLNSLLRDQVIKLKKDLQMEKISFESQVVTIEELRKEKA